MWEPTLRRKKAATAGRSLLSSSVRRSIAWLLKKIISGCTHAAKRLHHFLGRSWSPACLQPFSQLKQGSAGLVAGGKTPTKPRQREYPHGRHMGFEQIARRDHHVTTNQEVSNPLQRSYPHGQNIGRASVRATGRRGLVAMEGPASTARVRLTVERFANGGARR